MVRLDWLWTLLCLCIPVGIMDCHCHRHNLRGTLYGNYATILSLCLSYRFALEIQSIFYFKEKEIEINRSLERMINDAFWRPVFAWYELSKIKNMQNPISIMQRISRRHLSSSLSALIPPVWQRDRARNSGYRICRQFPRIFSWQLMPWDWEPAGQPSILSRRKWMAFPEHWICLAIWFRWMASSSVILTSRSSQRISGTPRRLPTEYRTREYLKMMIFESGFVCYRIIL